MRLGGISRIQSHPCVFIFWRVEHSATPLAAPSANSKWAAPALSRFPFSPTPVHILFPAHTRSLKGFERVRDTPGGCTPENSMLPSDLPWFPLFVKRTEFCELLGCCAPLKMEKK
eukprot:RCo007667